MGIIFIQTTTIPNDRLGNDRLGAAVKVWILRQDGPLPRLAPLDSVSSSARGTPPALMDLHSVICWTVAGHSTCDLKDCSV